MMIQYEGVRMGEWLTIIAALLGPILAVQAQKIVESGRSKRQMKNGLFQTLMATRASRLSSRHVEALNMVNIAFYGDRFFGFRWQSTAEKSICRAWRIYFDTLEIDNSTYSDDQNVRLLEVRFDKFIVLLGAIAIQQNYDFDPIDLRKNAYSPKAHGDIEGEHHEIRAGLAAILSGKKPFPMEVVNLPKK
jgi:hypothetical protein